MSASLSVAVWVEVCFLFLSLTQNTVAVSKMTARDARRTVTTVIMAMSMGGDSVG